MALQALVLVHEAYERGGNAWTQETLARRLHLPMESMAEIEGVLSEGGFIARSDGRPSRLVPLKPAQLVRVADVVAALRQKRERGSVGDEVLANMTSVDAFYDRLERIETELLENTLITDLLNNQDNSSVDVGLEKTAST
jgi:membrane protein